VRNLEPVEFLRVLLGARVLVGNSSVGIRECSFLGVPVVNIGTRQQGRERADNVFDVPGGTVSIRSATWVQSEHGRFPSSALYGDGHAGERIAKALMEWEA
jgi:UDP-N-acetylglucosamine 2-epimerase